MRMTRTNRGGSTEVSTAGCLKPVEGVRVAIARSKRTRVSTSRFCAAAGFVLLVVARAAFGQLSPGDIEALRERGRVEGWTFTVGENSATDRSLDQLTGLVVPDDWWVGARFDPCTPRMDLPDSFNWCDVDGCTSVKNQGTCGSCWAFATVGPLECNILIQDGIEVDLSEQWLVSCNQDGWGCNGGQLAHDYHQARPDPCGDSGAVLESDFPYSATDETCACPYSHEYLIEGWAYVGGPWDIPSPDLIKQAIMDHGPVSVYVYANAAMQAYTGGVFNGCENVTTDHAVVLVGWDDNQGPGGVWYMRNSWGSGWGEGGYMRMTYGCSRIGEAASYVDYFGQTSVDCNGNSIPDRCDVDCGPYDGPCDMPGCGQSEDCTGNFIPDECEPDCNENGSADSCDIQNNPGLDCNGNGVPDVCDLSYGTSEDCQPNGLPDECDIPDHDCCYEHAPAGCSDPDVEACVCAVVDTCCSGLEWGSYCVALVTDLGCATCTSTDCNRNDIPDECDVREGTSADCNSNSIPDECVPGIPIYIPLELDCNGNWVPDACDVSGGTSEDCQQDGLPDECQLADLADPGHGGVCSPTADHAESWCEDFESYGLGSIHGKNGWQGWGGDPEKAGWVTGQHNHTPDGLHGLRIEPYAVSGHHIDWYDTVHLFEGYDSVASPFWVLSIRVFIPLLMEGSARLTVLPDYDGGVSNTTTAVRLTMNCDDGLIHSEEVGTSYQLLRGEWFEIRLRIDFQRDWVEVFYAGVLLAEHSWTNAGGSLNIAAIELGGSGGSLDDPSNGFCCDDLALFCALRSDCNGNGVPDECDIAGGTGSDCNANGVPDACEWDVGLAFDCNDNVVLDECDIRDGTSSDCNENGVPDECELLAGTSLDCNDNDVPDECEIDENSTAPGGPFFCRPGVDVCARDCNANGVPDTCDLDAGTSEDCNGNHRPDECEIDEDSTAPGGPFFCISDCAPDCNDNGIIDQCDIPTHDCCRQHSSPGCTDPDIEACVCAADLSCCDVEWTAACVQLVTDLACGTCNSTDCNANEIPDECDIAEGTSPDCNVNGMPDECDIEEGTSTDCNGDRIPDKCEIDENSTAPGGSYFCQPDVQECNPDCNWNGVPDECDVDSDDPDGNGEVSEDCQIDGVPDECQLADVVVPPDYGLCTADAEGGKPWCEGFESYEDGLSIDGYNSWQGWNGDPGAAGLVTALKNHSPRGSLSLRVEKDHGHTVRSFDGYDLGTWRQWMLSLWVFVPSSMNGTAELNILADYDGGSSGEVACTLQTNMSPLGEGTIESAETGARVPVVADQWVEIRFGIDLGRDSVEIFYNETSLGTHQWTSAGGSLNIGALELRDPHTGGVYYDDLRLFPSVTMDCNGNGILDECDIDNGDAADCNGDAIPDDCEVLAGVCADCNGNAVPDDCDIALGTAFDCNGNAVPDECDIRDGTSADCQPNDIPDECDVAEGTSEDVDDDGTPDECQHECDTDDQCDDGLPCNGVETCNHNHVCAPGTPVDCDDGIDCTIDSCDEVNGACHNDPTDSMCGSDGDLCTEDLGYCDLQYGCYKPVDCDDEVACTDDSCDPTTGDCVHVVDHSLCNDGDACNGTETCDPVSGCLSGTPMYCDDGKYCNGTETCSGGSCVSVAGSGPCKGEDEYCSEPDRKCVDCLDASHCDDSDECTVDTCSAGICTHSKLPPCQDDDEDGVLNRDDACPGSDDHVDGDGDGLPDGCDDCPEDADNDADDDGVCGNVDNCPDDANSGQKDADGDGVGDACDPCPDDLDDDIDNDGLCGDIDNCPEAANPAQSDTDGDGLGDACDDCPNDADNDSDSDGVCGDVDNCPVNPNPNQNDADGDGAGNVCDVCPNDAEDDADLDRVCGNIDQCPGTPPGETVNIDGCADSQLDDDADSVSNDADQCPDTPVGEGVDDDGCAESQLTTEEEPGAPVPRSTGCGIFGMIPLLLTFTGLVAMRGWSRRYGQGRS